MSKSKTDDTEPTLSEVQTNILESEKINVSSSEINSSNLSVEKGKDSAATDLIPLKETSPSSETSLAKIHNPVEESIEKESLINSKTDNTEPTLSEVQTNKLESEKINIPSSENDSANISVEKEKDTEETSLNSPKVTSPSSESS